MFTVLRAGRRHLAPCASLCLVRLQVALLSQNNQSGMTFLGDHFFVFGDRFLAHGFTSLVVVHFSTKVVIVGCKWETT